MSDDPAAAYNRLARWHSILDAARLDAAIREADREQADLRTQLHKTRRALADMTRDRDRARTALAWYLNRDKDKP
jgi:outer membrane protein TolC